MEQHEINKQLSVLVRDIRGAYAILHVHTNGIYIGRAKDLRQAIYTNTTMLYKKTHWCADLQAAYNANPELRFIYVPVINKEDVKDQEKLLINKLKQEGKFFFNDSLKDSSIEARFGFEHLLEEVRKIPQPVENYDDRTIEHLMDEKFRKAMRGRAAAYILVHQATGGWYIGGTGDLTGRIYQHMWDLKRGIHHSKKFQAAYDQDSKLKIMVIRAENAEHAHYHEQIEIDIRVAEGKLLFNDAMDAFSPNKGVKASEETKSKMSASRKGKMKSAEWKEKISLSQINKGPPLMIEGIQYRNINEAMKLLGLTKSTINGRLISLKRPDWYKLEMKDKS